MKDTLDFGVPWEFVEHLTWPGFGIVKPIMTNEMGLIAKEIGQRIVADHNACAGIEDPQEAIEAAMDAIKNIMSEGQEYYDMDMGPNGKEAIAMCEAALAKLQPREP